MGGNGLLTAVPSRQKTERIALTFSVVDLLAPTKTSTSRARRATGYDAIVGLVSGTAGFSIDILGAPAVLNKEGGLEQPGIFAVLDTIVSALDAESGRQFAIIERQVKSAFVKVRITAGASKVEQIQRTIELVPVYSWRSTGGSNIPVPLPVDIVASIPVDVNVVAPLPIPVNVISGGSTPNRTSFEDNQQTVAVPGTAAQLQAQAIPDGFTVFVEALSTNKGNIYLGNSAADAQNHAKANILTAGAFRTFALKDVSAIWIDADQAGEGVQWTVEI